jgi:hypothetical protein
VKEAALALGLLSGLAGILSALALMRGSAPVPWDMQSYSGKSEPEIAHRASTGRWAKIGLGGLFLAFTLSAASAVASYLS